MKTTTHIGMLRFDECDTRVISKGNAKVSKKPKNTNLTHITYHDIIIIIIIIIINVKINVALSENASRTRYTGRQAGRQDIGRDHP